MSAAKTSTKSLRRLVMNADTADLIVAYTEGLRHPFAFLEVEGEVVFICPLCSHVSINGGTARLLGTFRWWCSNCRRTGTRYVLERLVLEDADMLEVLAELAVADEVMVAE